MQGTIFIRNLMIVNLTILLFSTGFSQTKKVMTPEVYKEWKRLGSEKISSDGKWIIYTLATEEGDEETILYNTVTNSEKKFSRLKDVLMSDDGKLVTALAGPPKSQLKELRRKKTKKEDLPGDSLFIYLPESMKEYRLPKVTDIKKSKYYSQIVTFKTETPDYKKDSIAQAADFRKQNKENGNHLVIFNTPTMTFDTIRYVKEYTLAEKSPVLYLYTSGNDSLPKYEVKKYFANDKTFQQVMGGKWAEIKLESCEKGENLIAIATIDSTKNPVKDRVIHYWKAGMAGPGEAINLSHPVIPDGWYIPDFTPVTFSKAGNYVYLGFAPKPVLADTNALEEEMVQVEVWHYKDPVLYTTQEVRLNQDKQKTYTFLYDFEENRIVQVTDINSDQVLMNKKANRQALLIQDRKKYGVETTWLGGLHTDVYHFDAGTGTYQMILEKTGATPRISPEGKYATWFDESDLKWKIYNFGKKEIKTLIEDPKITFYDELNDVPDAPNTYGIAGWTKNDEEILINDRYDIWAVNLEKNKKTKLTSGRNSKTEYRYIHTDLEDEVIDTKQNLLLRLFDEVTKESGYASLDFKSGKVKLLERGPFMYNNRVLKAANSKEMITKKESYQVYPDLLLTDENMNSFRKVSDANPQQNDYLWGSIEIIKWTNAAGEKLEGLVAKPENFDPEKKYPLIVNFYERSSDGLHSHRPPFAGRSTISYSYYTSKGYVVFNPDITYRTGYPGESCFEDLMTGVDEVIKGGYIDTTRMGLQGHSWGGYQVAYLLNKTNRFACAESGAPVVNMTSAYGGIRWESGMSRMFQYEKAQSRIGKSLWEAQDLYLSNSPLFEITKTNTPVLIMHNDADGAVPWYQGIEYYMALRRLNKPTWLLNYNGEPHWPVKWQNRLDFNIRMEQFFDHYLMKKSMPLWMQSGIPVIQKGIVTGYETSGK